MLYEFIFDDNEEYSIKIESKVVGDKIETNVL